MNHNKIFTFNDLKIKLINAQKKNIDFCTQYFDGYIKHQVDEDSLFDWTIQINNSSDRTREDWKTDEKNKCIKVFCHKDNSTFIMRIIRSLKILEDIKSNKLIFKGSCIVAKDGFGVVVMGPRRSGKTSLILSYLLKENDQSAFISNSIISLAKINNHYQAFGYPMAIGIRSYVIDSLINKGNVEFQQLLPIIDDKHQREDKRYYLNPYSLKKYLNGRVLTSAPVKAIVILKNIPSNETIEIKKLTSDEVKILLKRYQSKYFNKNNGSWYNLFSVDTKHQQ